MKRTLILACILLILSGCSSIRGERVTSGYAADAEPTSAATAAPLEPTATAELEPAPLVPIAAPADDSVALGDGDASISFGFQAQELYSGTTVEGSTLFGQGGVIVTFVQPDCEISVDGNLAISQVADENPEALYVFVHSGGDDAAFIDFAEESALFQENMVHLSDPAGDLATRYGINRYPTTLLIDTDLRISSVVGVMDAEAQNQAVATVLGRSPEL